MKITRNQIRKMIKEQLGPVNQPDYPGGLDSSGPDYDDDYKPMDSEEEDSEEDLLLYRLLHAISIAQREGLTDEEIKKVFKRVII